MPKTHLFFNPKTLSFEQKEFSFKEILKKVFWFLATALSFAVVILWISYYLIESPREKMLSRENNELKNEINRLDQRIDNLHLGLQEIQRKDVKVYRSIFETAPNPKQESYELLYNLANNSISNSKDASELLKKLDDKTNNLILQLSLESKSLDTLNNLAHRKSEMLAAIPAIRPIKGMREITSGFGGRFHPILKTLRMHTGVDIAAEKGTPVYATSDGVVEQEGNSSGYGIVVILNHGYSYETLYAHLSKRVVQAGQKVKRGQLIGYVGSTGLSVGPHLHYEVIKNGVKVNPVHYFFNDITPAEYDAILKSSKEVNQSLS